MDDQRFAAFLPTLLLACLSCSRVPQVDTAAEALAIRELDRQWQAAVEARDIEACLRFYAPGAVEMQPSTPAIAGLPAIRAWFESGLLQPGITNVFTSDTIEVAASGDLAYDRGTYRFSMETPDGRVEDVGKYLMIWKKIDGEWKVIADISNSDRPRPELAVSG
jgi:ketosteroid isomerase-like protein